MDLVNVAEGDLFAAWFELEYEPRGAFLEALLSIGVDPANLQRRYSSRQFVEAAKIIRAHAHARLDDDAAYREIGRALMRAFFRTPGGRLLSVVLRLVPTRTFLHRVPNYLRIGRPNVRVDTGDLPDGGVRLEVHDPDWCPAPVFVGVIDEAVRQTGSTPRLTPTLLGEGRMLLDVDWT